MSTATRAVAARADLRQQFHDVRQFTEALASTLSAEDQTVQSMPDVSPTKWHRAHTTWFFETFVLGPHSAGYRRFDPAYGYLFNSYYEAVGPRHPGRDGACSPARRRRGGRVPPAVDDAIDELLGAGDLDRRGRPLVELGLHHEQQHQELLLMDIKHVLRATRCARPTPGRRRSDAGAACGAGGGQWLDHPGGVVGSGTTATGSPSTTRAPPRGAAAAVRRRSSPVTAASGWPSSTTAATGVPRLWLSDGWAAVQAEGWEAPSYWRQDGDGWTVFTLHRRRRSSPPRRCATSASTRPTPSPAGPARLPTEAEWEVAAPAPRPPPGRHRRPRGPAPVARRRQWCGVWEWTASALPLPRLPPAAGAVGEYNGKFMVNQQVLRGGACVTPRRHTRPTYRNFFPRRRAGRSAACGWPSTW